MLPPPPTSTLFPYTTLFRSSVEGNSGILFKDQGAIGTAELVVQKVDSKECQIVLTSGEQKWTSRTDRKSTRLNSSHTVISYAVFCLKKKKFVVGARRPHVAQ